MFTFSNGQQPYSPDFKEQQVVRSGHWNSPPGHKTLVGAELML